MDSFNTIDVSKNPSIPSSKDNNFGDSAQRGLIPSLSEPDDFIDKAESKKIEI